MSNLTKEQIEQYAAQGILVTGTHAKLSGNISFEPPITLQDCVIVGPTYIGRHSYVSDFTHVAQQTTIGRYCSIGNSCTIGAQPHPLAWMSSHPFQYLGLAGADISTRPWPWTSTRLGNDVWIGSNVVVLGGVIIGDGAAVGAGAVVTQNVPPYGVVVGNPARLLKSRFDKETVTELLVLKWWDLPAVEIRGLPFDDITECLAQLRQIRRRIPC